MFTLCEYGEDVINYKTRGSVWEEILLDERDKLRGNIQNGSVLGVVGMDGLDPWIQNVVCDILQGGCFC